METGKNPHAVALGRSGGLARARRLSKKARRAGAQLASEAAKAKRKTMSARKRTALARKAARARWGKRVRPDA